MVSIFLHVLRESSELLVTVLSTGKLRPSPKAWQGSDLGACSLTDLIPETLIVILARVSAQASQFSTSPVRYVCVSCPYGGLRKTLAWSAKPSQASFYFRLGNWAKFHIGFYLLGFEVAGSQRNRFYSYVAHGHAAVLDVRNFKWHQVSSES